MVEKARGTGNSDLVRWIIDSSAEKLNCAMVPMNRPPPFKTHAESQATSCSLCLDEWRQPAASSKLTPRVTTLIIAGIPEGDVAYHMNELVCTYLGTGSAKTELRVKLHAGGNVFDVGLHLLFLEEPRALVPCDGNHIFHEECIYGLISQRRKDREGDASCPLCRFLLYVDPPPKVDEALARSSGGKGGGSSSSSSPQRSFRRAADSKGGGPAISEIGAYDFNIMFPRFIRVSPRVITCTYDEVTLNSQTMIR